MQQSKSNSDLWALLVGLLAVIGLGGIILAAASTNRPISSRLVQESSTPMSEITEVPETPNITITPGENETLVALAATSTYEATAFPSSEPFPTGIHDDTLVKAQLGKEGFDVQNAWFGILGDRQVWAYAGASRSDPDQGAIYVFLFLPNNTFEQRYLTSEKHGALRILSEQNGRLTLSSTDDTTFYFDIPAMQYVSSLTEVVPTATPLPTYTPVPFLPTLPPQPTGYPNPAQPGYPAPTIQSTASP